SDWWCTCNKRIIREWVNAVNSSPFTIVRGDVIMAPNLLLHQLLLVTLVLICFLLHVEWLDNPRATSKTSLKPDKPRRKRSTEPKPFTGLLHKPLCEACEKGADAPPKAPG